MSFPLGSVLLNFLFSWKVFMGIIIKKRLANQEWGQGRQLLEA